MSDINPYIARILGPDATSFLGIFETRWRKHLDSLPPKYREGKQLGIGSRLRPLLVAWGYLLAGKSLKECATIELADLAIYIELLHKATLLVDDILDQDDARRGEEAFHVEFSGEEAILVAVYLVGDCLEKLTASTNESNSGRLQNEVLGLLSAALKEMALGGIRETEFREHELPSVTEVKKIIELQTIAIIKNGLLTGYRFGHGRPDYEVVVDSLGFDCGYMFQVLNDLEPFLDSEGNARHKGSANFDFVRSRKNIAAALTFEELNPSERELYSELSQDDPSGLSSHFLDWFSKYDVLSSIVDDLRLVNDNISANVETLPLSQECREGFRSFVDFVLSVAIRRLGDSHYERLSKIVIR